ncbi:hypothetical protein EDB92DRAFT_1817208 [Lactarius akahatsu]|uniref:Uncharacterized protein n=1 Tax=Lactarius akahatsu TaxID=416441 RepID=A0AAD4QCR9_9AGAM|nr:hypothetical protein EDB92DRAFT_1817208 [Lactarius akahatsu]
MSIRYESCVIINFGRRSKKRRVPRRRARVRQPNKPSAHQGLECIPRGGAASVIRSGLEAVEARKLPLPHCNFKHERRTWHMPSELGQKSKEENIARVYPRFPPVVARLPSSGSSLSIGVQLEDAGPENGAPLQHELNVTQSGFQIGDGGLGEVPVDLELETVSTSVVALSRALAEVTCMAVRLVTYFGLLGFPVGHLILKFLANNRNVSPLPSTGVRKGPQQRCDKYQRALRISLKGGRAGAIYQSALADAAPTQVHYDFHICGVIALGHFLFEHCLVDTRSPSINSKQGEKTDSEPNTLRNFRLVDVDRRTKLNGVSRAKPRVGSQVLANLAI